MKNKCFLVLALTLLFMVSVNAASYKVNTSGTVSTKTNGKTTTVKQTNYFNNYQSKDYVSNAEALKGSIGTIDIVMDYSGSMANWIKVAKQTFTKLLAQLPSSTQIGFRVFGSDGSSNESIVVTGDVKDISKGKKGKYKVGALAPAMSTGLGCTNTKSLVPISQKNSTRLIAAMNSVDIGGSTPLTLALYQSAYRDFLGLSQNFKKKIILITDGGETCGGDPCEFARQLMKKRNDIVIDVVLVSASSNALYCVTKETGGNLYSVNDIDSFNRAINQSVTDSVKDVETQPSQGFEFLN